MNNHPLLTLASLGLIFLGGTDIDNVVDGGEDQLQTRLGDTRGALHTLKRAAPLIAVGVVAHSRGCISWNIR